MDRAQREKYKQQQRRVRSHAAAAASVWPANREQNIDRLVNGTYARAAVRNECRMPIAAWLIYEFEYGIISMQFHCGRERRMASLLNAKLCYFISFHVAIGLDIPLSLWHSMIRCFIHEIPALSPRFAMKMLSSCFVPYRVQISRKDILFFHCESEAGDGISAARQEMCQSM